MSHKISFIIADNQDITKAGLYHYISTIYGNCNITDVSDKEELISTLFKHKERVVVILDYTLFDFNNPDELIQIGNRFPEVYWILFSGEINESMVRKMSPEKTFGIVLKENSGDEIRTALKCASDGTRFLCHQITNMLLSNTYAPNLPSVLTTTETDILKFIALGKSVKEIAALRTSSIHTIVTHKKNIFRKLNVNTVHEATKYALRAGLIEMVEYYI